MLESGTMDFPDARSSLNSPLAKSLFTIAGVQRVFFGNDFITVTKKPDVDWHEIKVTPRCNLFSRPLHHRRRVLTLATTARTHDTHHAGANIRQHYGLLRVGRVGGERAPGYLQHHHPAHGYPDTTNDTTHTRCMASITHIFPPLRAEQIRRPWR